MKCFFSLLLVLSFGNLFSQDVVTTMSGRALDCQIIDDLGIEIRFQIVKENGKIKELTLHRSEIFSIQKVGNEEWVLYAKDDVLGDWMTVDEMRVFIAGEQDARDAYQVKWIMGGGFTFGAGLAYLAQGGLIVSIAGPIIYTLVQLIPNIRIKKETIADIHHQYNDIYALGYERVARPKRLLAGLKSATAGMVVGIGGWLVFPLRK